MSMKWKIIPTELVVERRLRAPLPLWVRAGMAVLFGSSWVMALFLSSGNAEGLYLVSGVVFLVGATVALPEKWIANRWPKLRGALFALAFGSLYVGIVVWPKSLNVSIDVPALLLVSITGVVGGRFSRDGDWSRSMLYGGGLGVSALALGLLYGIGGGIPFVAVTAYLVGISVVTGVAVDRSVRRGQDPRPTGKLPGQPWVHRIWMTIASVLVIAHAVAFWFKMSPKEFAMMASVLVSMTAWSTVLSSESHVELIVAKRTSHPES